MNFDKVLKQYLKSSAKSYVLTIVLLIVSIALIFGFINLNSHYDSKEPVKFTRGTKKIHTDTLTYNISQNGYINKKMIHIIVRWI